MRIYLHTLAILALILMGVSPACKFISGGESFMEICTVNGIERIAMNDTPADAPDDEHGKNTDCAFCFTQTNLKSFQTASITIAVPVDLPNFAIASLNTQTHALRGFTPQNPRAPPLQV